MLDDRPDFSFIVKDNEQALINAINNENYIQAFLLAHALIECLLRLFLNIEKKNYRFNDIIKAYIKFLQDYPYPIPTFVNDLEKLNQRRNRIIHMLWKNGYSHTNNQTKDAANVAVMMYGLFIEWLETFDPEITKLGFKYN